MFPQPRAGTWKPPARLAPDEPAALLKEGREHFVNARLELARNYFDQAVAGLSAQLGERDPETARAMAELGRALQSLGRSVPRLIEGESPFLQIAVRTGSLAGGSIREAGWTL